MLHLSGNWRILIKHGNLLLVKLSVCLLQARLYSTTDCSVLLAYIGVHLLESNLARSKIYKMFRHFDLVKFTSGNTQK